MNYGAACIPPLHYLAGTLRQCNVYRYCTEYENMLAAVDPLTALKCVYYRQAHRTASYRTLQVMC